MRRLVIGLLAVVMVLVALQRGPFGAAEATTSVTDIADPDAYTCSQPGYIDFEAYADGFNLSAGAISGVQFTTTGGFTWLVGDFDTGLYNGKYPSGGYTSEGTHWAWLGPQQSSGRIDFVTGPASYFSLLTSAFSPVSLDAYDSGDVLLETAGPSANNYNTGHMDELKVSRPAADIAYVIGHDVGDYFEIDAICTDAPGVGEVPPGPPVVGGVAGLLNGSDAPADAPTSSSGRDFTAPVVVAAVAAVVALAAGGWYVRRPRIR